MRISKRREICPIDAIAPFVSWTAVVATVLGGALALMKPLPRWLLTLIIQWHS